MISDRTIICLASNWSYDPTSKHHVMRVLSQRNDIIWVNYHASRRPTASAADARAIARKLGEVAAGPQQVAPRIRVLTPMVVPLPGNATVAKVNHGLLVRQIRAAMRDLPPQPVQVWTFAPDVGHLRGAFEEELFLYYCVDEFAEFAGYDREAIAAAELRTIEAADVVVTTSSALYETKRRICPAALLVPHGVDYAHFSAAPTTRVPADVADLRGPVLGFFGMISDWVDVALLSSVARARPEWNLVLVGEERTDISPLDGLTNVRRLGRRPYAALPGYCRRFDVGLIPFHVNALTRAVNPIKLREYLAAGIAVVSTALPEARRFGGLVEVVEEAGEFVEACETALGTRSVVQDERRRRAVEGCDWGAVVADLEERISRRRVLI